MRLRARPAKSVVVSVGEGRTDDRATRALVESLNEAGVETLYLGREQDAHRIAASLVESHSDAVEVCLTGGSSMAVLRELLRELIRLGRGEASIVVHRVL